MTGTPPVLIRQPLDDLDITSQKFPTRDSAKTWLISSFKQHKNIDLVTARSDKQKMVFQCRIPGKKHRHMPRSKSARRTNTCPFKVRANFSVRTKCWALSVVNDNHDHPLPEPPKESLKYPDTLDDSFIGDSPLSNEFTSIDEMLKVSPSPKEDLAQKSPQFSHNHILQLLRDDISAILDKRVFANDSLLDQDKQEILKRFLVMVDSRYSNSGWIGATTSLNAIPLSPLLNDNELSRRHSSENSVLNAALSLDHHPTLDSFHSMTHYLSSPAHHTLETSIGGPSTGFSVPSHALANVQSLPSFNMIQNRLPLSPTSLSNSSTPSLFTSAPLMPPSTASFNSTLNPSHLLKSLSKSTILQNQSNLSLGDFSLSSHKKLKTINYQNSLPLGLSSPNSNIISNTGAGPSSGNGGPNILNINEW